MIYLFFFHRLGNKNHDFTLISRGCIGGLVYHQYGMRFLSPTINLSFSLYDFNLFCNYLQEYINGKITKCENNVSDDYPVGSIYPTDNSLPSIKVLFIHYSSYEESYKKWEERKKRINWNNIFVINKVVYDEEHDSVDKDIINEFNRIPYKKVLFTNKSRGFNNEFIVKVNGKELFHKKKYVWKYPFNSFNFNRFLKR